MQQVHWCMVHKDNKNFELCKYIVVVLCTSFSEVDCEIEESYIREDIRLMMSVYSALAIYRCICVNGLVSFAYNHLPAYRKLVGTIKFLFL